MRLSSLNAPIIWFTNDSVLEIRRVLLPISSAESLVNQIMGAFNDDNLTESQEYVVELLLHLSHQDSIFNLNRALAVWSDEDQAAFIAMIRGNPN